MEAAVRKAGPWAAAILLLAVLLASQAAADGLVPPSEHAATGVLVGRAGFAYLTGMREFAAAALWNRLDPINDGYYNGVPLGEKTFLVPSFRLITWLDPAFEEPYYVGPWLLYDAGEKSTALQMAQEGVRSNPESAYLRSSYAQLLLTEGRLADARKQADMVMTETWKDPAKEFEALATLEIIFNKTGRHDLAQAVVAERERLRATYGFGGAGQPAAGQGKE